MHDGLRGTETLVGVKLEQGTAQVFGGIGAADPRGVAEIEVRLGDARDLVLFGPGVLFVVAKGRAQRQPLH